jgi:hypothetical protein
MDQPARFKFGEGEDEWSATNPQRWDNVLQEEIAKIPDRLASHDRGSLREATCYPPGAEATHWKVRPLE